MISKNGKSSDGDASSVRLDVGAPSPRRRGGSTRLAPADPGSASIFEPRPEDSSPTVPDRDGGELVKAPAPEKQLTLFALRLAVLEKGASSLGTLAFVWATVVLLGGFAIKLRRVDFWVVTIILVSEAARIFGRSRELEWQHQSTRDLGGGGVARGSLRALESSSRFLARTFNAFCDPLSAALPKSADRSRIAAEEAHAASREFLKKLVRYRSQRAWHAPEVPFLPYARRLFVAKNVSRALSWLQIASAAACVTLSLLRLARHDYGEVDSDSKNRGQALDLFYSLALAEALLFLLEKLYWAWRVSYGQLLVRVSEDCDLGPTGVVSVRRFFYDVYSQCITGSIFDGVKMDLVSFAQDLLLESDFLDEQLVGVRILERFAASPSFRAETLRKLGTNTRVMERLLDMLNWKNPEEEEIRRAAAEIVSKLAGRRHNALRVAAIPGAMDSVASLLRASGSDDYDCNLLGLQTLERLAADHDNCFKIGTVRGLLPRIIEFTSTGAALLRNEHAPESQIQAVARSLQVVKMLAGATGQTGKFLRREIAEIIFTVSNLRQILQHGERHLDLKKLAIEILTSLAMDDTAKERIASTGGVVRLLLESFFAAEVAEEDNVVRVSGEAGEALAMLSLECRRNCMVILRKGEAVLARLVAALQHPALRLNASRILRNLCAYSGSEAAHLLRPVTAAMSVVLKTTMTQKEKLLEVSIGLTTLICKSIGPEKFSEELQRAEIEEADYARMLVETLKQYKYPEIKVPRIRRFVIQQAIWMMRSDQQNYLQLFRDLEMEALLHSVADTTSDLECFHVFSGSVGLSQHRKTVSSLVDSALELLVGGSCDDDE